jgi:hypothetical protein
MGSGSGSQEPVAEATACFLFDAYPGRVVRGMLSRPLGSARRVPFRSPLVVGRPSLKPPLASLLTLTRGGILLYEGCCGIRCSGRLGVFHSGALEIRPDPARSSVFFRTS